MPVLNSGYHISLSLIAMKQTSRRDHKDRYSGSHFVVQGPPRISKRGGESVISPIFSNA